MALGSPHLHAIVLPVVRKRSKRQGLQRFVSHRSHPCFADEPEMEELSYERFQTSMARDFAPLGLERGEQTALANRVAEFLGLPKEPVPHRTTSEWRAEQERRIEELDELIRFQATENTRQATATLRLEGAEHEAKRLADRARQQEKAAIKREAAAKDREAKAAHAEAEATAFVRGAEALVGEELEYCPAMDERPEALVDGPAASPDPSIREKLRATIRPAADRLIRFGRQVWRFRQKMLADVSTGERKLARDAQVLDAAYRKAGRESPAELRSLISAQHARDRRSMRPHR